MQGAIAEMQQLEDLRTPELCAASVLVAGILLFGLWPSPLIELSTATIRHMHILIGHSL